MSEHVELSSSGAALAQEERIRKAARADRAAQRQKLFQSLGILVPFVAVLLVAVLIVPNFLTASNVSNVLISGGILAIAAYGMTIVISLRGIDLSVGSAQAVVACVTAFAVNSMGLGGILVGLLAGVALGLINAAIIVWLKVPAFIATLATLSIFRGLALLITGGAPIMIKNEPFRDIATASLIGIPVPFLIAVLIGAGFWFVLDRTVFGRHLVAVGSNPEAATESGIPTKRIAMTAYVVCSLSAAAAGVLLASQLGSVSGSLSTGLELQIIAVVVLGGTSMTGGRSRIVGTFLAAFLLAMINSGLNLLNVASFYQYIALGALLILALSLDSVQRAAIKKMLQGGRR